VISAAVLVTALWNSSRIEAAALLEQEAVHRVAAQLLHGVAIAEGLALAVHRQPPLSAVHLAQLEVAAAQRHEGVKERPPFITAHPAFRL
jgi:hypothetical protein